MWNWLDFWKKINNGKKKNNTMISKILFSLEAPQQPKKAIKKTKTPRTMTPAAIVVELSPGTSWSIA